MAKKESTRTLHKRSRRRATAESTDPIAERADFCVVGIGASAGGLDALERFFRRCPADLGMALVLLQHLDPVHASLLTEIIQRSTDMPVVEALDQVRVEPNHVYVIPPNREMEIKGGMLHLSVPNLPRGQRMPIDSFLRSLAVDLADRSIGVILSGSGTDGTLGLRAIHGAGGICLVQEPSTAKFAGMPQSAISAGYATHIVPVEAMPDILRSWTHQPFLPRTLHPTVPVDFAIDLNSVSSQNQILLQVRSATGHDFSLYKKSTILRRIIRRMEQLHIADLTAYSQYLTTHSAEVVLLFKELLINVTSFFRDPEAFLLLQQTILPSLLEHKPDHYVFRVWVAGCATGEEAYSIAILLQELLDERLDQQRVDFSFQIFATDLDEDAITVARAGSYPPNIAQDVTPNRLRRFFVQDDAGYRVKKGIREKVIFAVQNVIKDPPFTKLDLLSFRNVMIYLEPELQSRLIPTLHYALRPKGVLFLSASESITKHPELFSALDRRWKFYQANPVVSSSACVRTREPAYTHSPASSTASTLVTSQPKTYNIAELSQRALLKFYAPAAVTTDLTGNILYVHGDTGRYLRPAPGPVTTDVVEMAREGLQPELRAAIHRAASEGQPTLNREVQIKTDDGLCSVRFGVRLLPVHGGSSTSEEVLLLLTFQDGREESLAAAKKRHKTRAAPPVSSGQIEHLERELAYAKESLQVTLEDQQASTEELRSTNEELQSANEELQSSNEEMETSREEMQSLNEELLTTNAELTTKIEQLGGIQNDMKNLFDSISSGILFLDHHLFIRRYTRGAVKVFRLIDADVGRPLEDIKSNLEGDDLLDELQAVLDTLIPREREVRTMDGSWYLARIQPYRTLDNVIEGVVLSFTEVTAFKLASESVRRSEAMLATAQEIAHLGSWELDVAAGLVHCSGEMFKILDYPAVDAPVPLVKLLGVLSAAERERVTAAIKASVETGLPFDIRYRITRQNGTQRDVHSRARVIADSQGRVTRLIGSTLDITETMLSLGSLHNDRLH